MRGCGTSGGRVDGHSISTGYAKFGESSRVVGAGKLVLNGGMEVIPGTHGDGEQEHGCERIRGPQPSSGGKQPETTGGRGGLFPGRVFRGKTCAKLSLPGRSCTGELRCLRVDRVIRERRQGIFQQCRTGSALSCVAEKAIQVRSRVQSGGHFKPCLFIRALWTPGL